MGSRLAPSAAVMVLAWLVAAWAPVSAAANRDGGPREAASASRKVALGVARPDGRSLDDLDAFSASVGRKPAIWVIWSQWGLPGTQRFPTALATGLVERGVTPMIWWEPVDPRDLDAPTFARHRTITRGDYDAYIRQFAQDAKAFGRVVLLRFAHEANAKYFPWSIHRFDNSAETFIDAWRHVHDIFAEVGATNVRFLWSVNNAKVGDGPNRFAAMYPGDAYVDVMGLGVHNFGSPKPWHSLYDVARRAVHQLAAVSERPIIIAESSTSNEGGSKADWIREGYPQVFRRLPRVRAIVYLDADLRRVGQPDWRLSKPRRALRAYAAVAALARFQEVAPFG